MTSTKDQIVSAIEGNKLKIAREILNKHYLVDEAFTEYEIECILKAMEEYARIIQDKPEYEYIDTWGCCGNCGVEFHIHKNIK